MPLTPEEAHLFAAIDGVLHDEELCVVTGKTPAALSAMLDKLVNMGLVSFDGNASDGDRRPAFADGIELASAARAQIDAMAARLHGESHYQLLGIPQAAGTKEIRSAYYLLAPRFHPDRHFRKNLGPYKQRIEAIFSALTKAYETLRHPKRRRAYDAKALAADPLRAPARAASRSQPAPASNPPDPPSSRPPPSPGDVAASPSSAPGSAPVAETEEQRQLRRDILARKLSRAGSIPPPPASAATAPRTVGSPAPSPQIPNNPLPVIAAEAPPGRSDRLDGDVRQRRLRRYLDSADQAMSRGDYRAAAAAFLQASRLIPEDPELARNAAHAAKLADGK